MRKGLVVYMTSLTDFRFSFTPNWLISIITFLVVSVFVSLGIWQLHRAEEKKQRLFNAMQFDQQAPRPWHYPQQKPAAYEKIIVQGRFLSHLLLLDNQHQDHRLGYHVISPFVLTSGAIILVDRGWVAAALSRRQLPNIDTPIEPLTLLGHVYYPSTNRLLLGTVLEKKKDKIAVVEWLDLKVISQFIHKRLEPFILRLDKKEPFGFVREWPIVSMPPERHYAYAMQWFALAFVTLVLFIALNMKRKP